MRTPLATILVAFWLPFVGCNSSSSTADGAPDRVGSETLADLEGDAFSCGPPNDIGVGAVCSMGGGQCAAFGASGASLCACDINPVAPCLCSRTCLMDSQCGSGALCCPLPTSGIALKACVSMGCLQMGACPALPDGAAP